MPLLSLAGSLWAADGAPPAEPLRFRTAVDLALQHSGVMGIATVNQWRSQKAYQEVRNHWLPQLTVGSGLGYSYGFPLTLEGSAPSVANFTSTQSLFNLSLQAVPESRQDRLESHFLRRAGQACGGDPRCRIVLCATGEPDRQAHHSRATPRRPPRRRNSSPNSACKEGVDSKLDLTKSQLAAARIRLRIADAQGQADVLREHLAKLTGLSPADIQPDPESMPQLPLISQEDDLSARAVANSPVVKLADQKVEAAAARAKGEHRATLPFADLASQYAYLARFNNYDQYFLKYSSNNLAAGLNIKFPFFNPVQKARAAQADADTIVARKQADLTRNQVSEDALKLQRSLRQLQAARDVAKLEWQVSQGDLEAVQARIQTGTANIRDAQMAQLEVNDKYAAYLDAEFELTRAGLQLLRLTGELENWAIPSP